MEKARIKSTFLKLKEGKKEYFSEFYNLTKTSVYFTARKFSRDEYFIEDVMQEAYISFLNNIHRVDGDPLPYLITATKNKALDAIKKDKNVDKSVEIEDLPIAKTDEYSTDFPLLDKCRQTLTDEEFYILENIVLLGYTQTEVARKLNKPVSTVNYTYKTILKKLSKIKKEAYR